METFPALQVTSQDLALLRDNWYWLLSDCQSPDECKQATYLMLAKQYSSKNRFYHNLHHIAEMIRSIDSFRERLQNSQSVYLAVWFHDAVYNTRSSDNEEKSARLAMTEMEKLMVPPENRQIVEKLILQTKTHDPESPAIDVETAIFLDSDLSILGSSTELYSQYSKAIRKEYSRVPKVLYRNGRKKILESFLTKKRIYITDQMAERFEYQARTNIAAEIESL